MATHYFTLSSKTAQIKKTVNSLLHTYDSWADDLARDDLVRSDPARLLPLPHLFQCIIQCYNLLFFWRFFICTKTYHYCTLIGIMRDDLRWASLLFPRPSTALPVPRAHLPPKFSLLQPTEPSPPPLNLLNSSIVSTSTPHHFA